MSDPIFAPLPVAYRPQSMTRLIDGREMTFTDVDQNVGLANARTEGSMLGRLVASAVWLVIAGGNGSSMSGLTSTATSVTSIDFANDCRVSISRSSDASSIAALARFQMLAPDATPDAFRALIVGDATVRLAAAYRKAGAQFPITLGNGNPLDAGWTAHIAAAIRRWFDTQKPELEADSELTFEVTVFQDGVPLIDVRDLYIDAKRMLHDG